MQVVCGLSSIVTVTIFATKFSRYESQDSNRAPWRHQKLISDKQSKSQTRSLLSSESHISNSAPTEQISNAGNDVPDTAEPRLPRLTSSDATSGNKDSGIEADESDFTPPPLPPRANTMLAPSRPPSRIMHSNELDSILTEKDYKKMPFLRYSYVERNERKAEMQEMSNRRSSYHYLQAIESDVSNRNSNDVKPIITAPDFPAPPPPDKFSTVAR